MLSGSSAIFDCGRKPTIKRIEIELSIPILERTLARLPDGIRWAIANHRYNGQLDHIKRLQTGRVGDLSLLKTEQLQTIFVHVPKTAGVSVSNSLFGSQAGSHTPLFLYLSLYGHRRFDEMYKFTFVRNPWDRLISAFNYLKSGGMHSMDADWARNNLGEFSDVNDFVERRLVDQKIRNWIHFRDQSYFLTDPRTRKIGVDFIGRYENLHSDFNKVCQCISVDAELQKMNASVTGEATYKDVLSINSINMISKIYYNDIKNLKY
jgi:hypothetical protein